MEVKKENLVQLLEEATLLKLSKDSYEIQEYNPSAFLTGCRFDLGFKLLYLSLKDKNPHLAEKIYLEHIRAFSLGNFTEPGNAEKIGQQKFIDVFNDVYQAIKTNGFQSNRSLIPISNNSNILNGSHRLAACLSTKSKFYGVETEIDDSNFDYLFFKNRGVSKSSLDFSASKIAEDQDKTFIALVWPVAKGKQKEIHAALGDVIYSKEVVLNENGSKNLISQVYKDEKWLGDRNASYPGAINKVVNCFKGLDPLRVIVFTSESLEEVLEIKKKVRSIFSLGKHAIHITDTHEEVIELSSLLLNDNSIHFLNHAHPFKFPSLTNLLNQFKLQLEQKNIDINDVVVDSGMIMSAYGIRKTNDLDFLISEEELENAPHSNEIEAHNKYLSLYDIPLNDLLYNPRNYFYFNSIKFLSLDNLINFKENRAETKDKMDLLTLNEINKSGDSSNLIEKAKIKVFFFIVRSKGKLINLVIKMLKTVNLYDFVRQVYHNRKNRLK